MESALFGYFCLPYTSASVDYFRHCNFEVFSWFDLFVFPRDVDDYRGSVVDYSTLYRDCNGYPEKRPAWYGLCHCRNIVNYIFLCFYIFLGFDQKCFLSSSRQKLKRSQVYIFFRGILQLSRNSGRFIWAENFSLLHKKAKTEILSQVNEAMTIIDWLATVWAWENFPN